MKVGDKGPWGRPVIRVRDGVVWESAGVDSWHAFSGEIRIGSVFLMTARPVFNYSFDLTNKWHNKFGEVKRRGAAFAAVERAWGCFLEAAQLEARR